MKFGAKSIAALSLFIIVTVSFFGVSVRTLLYTVSLIAFTILQALSPQVIYKDYHSSSRWPINYLIAFIIIVLSSVPTIAAAHFAEEYQLGVLNIIEVHTALKIIATVLILDFVFYVLHLNFHKNRSLWRFHRVHHCDLVLDTSTFGRDHFVTGACLGIGRSIPVLLLGLPVEGVAFFLALVSIFLPFIHSNIYLPVRIDKLLGKVFMTPRIHLIHHSSEAQQTDSNYGVLFVWWDKLFKTFQNPYDTELDKINIGLKEWQKHEELTFIYLIKMPWK